MTEPLAGQVPYAMPVGPPPREPERPRPAQTNHILHLLLTLVTFGLWAVIWFAIAVNNHANAKADEHRYEQAMREYREAYIHWQFSGQRSTYP